jgi:aminopeptidase
MKDPRLEKLADVLVNYSTEIKTGDKVIIQGSTLAEPLLKEVYAKVLQAGGHPLVVLGLPGMDELLYRYASDEQLGHVPEPYKLAFTTYDARIYVHAEENTKGLTTVDPAKMAIKRLATKDLMETMMQRTADGEFKWVITLYPAPAHAQDAEMGLAEYEDFVFGACMPDMDDPVGYWKAFSARQDKIVEWLKGREKVHVTAPGTDLRLSVAGRIFVNADGHYNMPSGEVFTGPVEDSAEGHVTFSYPAIYAGHEVTGVQLWFEKGKVVRATADKGEEFLLTTLDTDEGSRYLGEFAIGTNEGINRFTGQILFDEKIGGSFHMAVGAGYPETGSVNKSSLHWDMICDLREGGQIEVDGEVLYRNGEFAIDF